MPVEESGNMLILLAALAHVEGNADFAGRYWPQATRWAEYLAEKGFDPEKQLCTDDFAGHLAHNVNLSVKAIEALAAYGQAVRDARRPRERGEVPQAGGGVGREMGRGGRRRRPLPPRLRPARHLEPEVQPRLGPHPRFQALPSGSARKEIAFYRKTSEPLRAAAGQPQAYAKLDWSVWTATLADSREDFEAIVDPLVRLSPGVAVARADDGLVRDKEGQEVGFQARSVVGGVFIKLLADPATWKKWAGRDKTKTGEWAPLPKPPLIKEVVPTSRREPAVWRYTTEKPADGWQKPDFDDKEWKEGPGGFGTAATPGSAVHTEWKSDDIWIRREIDCPKGTFPTCNCWSTTTTTRRSTSTASWRRRCPATSPTTSRRRSAPRRRRR